MSQLLSQELVSTIITREGDEFFVCITEITQKEIKFKKNCVPSDPIETFSLLRVFLIISPNGDRTYYKNGRMISIQERPLNVAVRCKDNELQSTPSITTNGLNTNNKPQEINKKDSNSWSFIDNETLIKIKSSGKADSEIMELIKKTPHKFDTSVDQIKHLASNGISSELIRFIMSN